MGLLSDDIIGHACSPRGQPSIVPMNPGPFGCSMISASGDPGPLWFMMFSCRLANA